MQFTRPPFNIPKNPITTIPGDQSAILRQALNWEMSLIYSEWQGKEGVVLIKIKGLISL